MATGIIFDNPDTTFGADASDCTIDVDLVGAGLVPVLGYVGAADRSIVTSASAAPDVDSGEVDFSLEYNADITDPAGTAYRATYRVGQFILGTRYFQVDTPGPTHILDALVTPTPAVPEFSADYSETFVSQSTSAVLPESFSTPLVINPYVPAGPVELIAKVPAAWHSDSPGGVSVSIYEGSTELVRGQHLGSTDNDRMKLEASREFANGELAVGFHTFEAKKWAGLFGATGHLDVLGTVTPISLKMVRR